MNELVLRTTEMFGEVETNIYENESYEMFMTARQLGECLGYADKTGLDNLISRHPYIKNSEFSGTVKLRVPQGNGYSIQKTRVFNEDGIYKVTFLSNTDKALEFRNWVRKLLKALRKGDIQLTMNNVTFSQEMFEAALAKHLGGINDRITALETKPTQPNYWLWKKHIANSAIDSVATALNIDTRAAYDTVYDNMSAVYGFDKSFALNQFCVKYEIETASVIDAIADCPQYQVEFIQTVNNLLSTATPQEHVAKQLPTMDKVQSVMVV